uniref:RBR-type E3 ubiquitin transferase n=1 Tax=Panagrolaimus sp. ES5 TaxID=591445 RepID=A0AC34FN58_9BILA
MFKKRGLKMNIKPKYCLYTYDQIINEVEKVSQDAAEILGFSAENCKIMLYHFKWNSMKLTEKFYDASSAKEFIKKSGIKYILDDSLNEDTVTVDECKICKEMKDVAILTCSHLFCFDCWKSIARSAKDKLADSDVLPYLTCDFEGCEAPIPETFTLQLFRDPETYHFYQHMVIQSFIQSNPLYKWCPNKSNGCKFAVKIDNSEVEEVTCECGFTYCFNCHDLPHSPFPCILIQKWKREIDLRVATSDPDICEYKTQNDLLKTGFQELVLLEKIKDGSVEFLKTALKFLHNFRQKMLYFYAFSYYLQNRQLFKNFQYSLQSLMQNAANLLNAPYTLKLVRRIEECHFPWNKQLEIIDVLVQIQNQLEAQVKSFYEDDWRFRDKEIEKAMLECKY